MNIFYIDSDPVVAAQQMVDKHVVKMILETAQLLSTAHRVLDGEMWIDDSSGRKIKRWRHPIAPLDAELYKATHVNHPSAIWVRQSNNNYNWLYFHFISLLDEYTHRYNKQHACEKLRDILSLVPKNIITGYLSPPTLAMPDEHKVADNAVLCYRHYYKYGKSSLHKWTNRPIPEWITDDSIQEIPK